MKKLISILLMTIMVLNLSGVTFADSETIVSQSGVLQLYQVYNDKGASFSPLNYDTCYKLSETEKPYAFPKTSIKQTESFCISRARMPQ